ncbi:MAG TPA: alanine racemase [Pyrinomonadaceae bacterium]|nr:alanine racemase [Pyrinomonadaceae bacterium]HMP64871.1 alanine racemase [Pyrinomonadaceae bacterium]
MLSPNTTEIEPHPGRPTVAEIDLSALVFNFRSIRDFVGTEIAFMAVVKANAYGHGAVKCAEALENAGVDWFGVAIVEEALELRQNGISLPILCFGGLWPGQEEVVIESGVTPVILTIEMAELLNDAAERHGCDVGVHIKIDTGMGRVGTALEHLDEFLDGLARSKRLKIDGVMTHFATADDPAAVDLTRSQISRFNLAVEKVRARGHDPKFLDMANSPGAVAFPESRGDLVRIGGILYGLGGDVLPAGIPAPELKPVMSIKSRIAFLKEVPPGTPLGYGRSFITERPSRIATIPIGYNDGYPRALSNRAAVLVHERKVPVCGRISMDWTIIDVTDVPEARIGTEVTVIGTSGDKAVLAEDLASWANTISYEITCGIGTRIPRNYFNIS